MMQCTRNPASPGRTPTGIASGLLAAALCIGAGCGPALAGDPDAPPPSPTVHETHCIEGWTLRIDTRLLTDAPEATATAVALLRSQLQEIVRQVPPQAVERLREVPLWFSPLPRHRSQGRVSPRPGWLRANQRNPEMARAVEFTNIAIFDAETRRMPNFALHELAHAYHDRFLPDGFDNAEIRAAHEAALARGTYDQVPRRDAGGGVRLDRAYALTNPMEYFAETTEAYFSRNDFFPFDRAELEEADPGMSVLLGRLWGVPDPPDPAGR